MGAEPNADTAAFQGRFEAALERWPIRDWSGRRILIAFSGGLDSTVLLHALARFGPSRQLVAVHVDHGLHADSARWSEHCEHAARSLGIPFRSLPVAVEPDPGQSLEAVARDARYRALAGAAEPGDIVMTAHHADDQLETVLLRLLRGTGVRGLTAIRDFAELGDGFLARPLLDFRRADLEAQARHWQLDWVEDPSNAD
ncbi:MAG: tRNA lysidine(34) synthetase TilS, partial [Gammaproteobacteria bacterium]|nr:tRNA lysidine(34) synthetase TilS [Gammaproteobacteria bacterium]